MDEPLDKKTDDATEDTPLSAQDAPTPEPATQTAEDSAPQQQTSPAPQPSAPQPSVHHPLPPHVPRSHTVPDPYTKSPGLAAFLSIAPGLGNIYNGLYLRGVAFFLTHISLFALSIQVGDRRGSEGEMAFLIPSLFFFWGFNIFDAYRQATLINYHGADPAERPKDDLPTSGNLAAGTIIFLVGLYGLLFKYFDFRIAWILDLWPFALMLLGGYLIRQHFKNDSKTTTQASEFEI